MQSSNNASWSSEESAAVFLKAGLLLTAIGLNALEFFIPRIPFLPWLKPGLANVVTIIWILRFGTMDALVFSLLRVWIVGFYFGFSFITLSLSFSGGIVSTLVMGIAWSLLGKRNLTGLVGLGIIGAFSHNAGQIAMVYVMMAHDVHLFYQVPFMLVASVLFGGFTGLLAGACYYLINDTDAISGRSAPVRLLSPPPLSPIYAGISCIIFAASIGVMFVKPLIWLTITAEAVTIIVQFITRGSIRAMSDPLRRFWLLFVFVGAVYLFLSYGRKIPGIPIITYEGMQETIAQWLRLWTWLQLSVLLARYRFNDLFLAGMRRLFPAYQTTIFAGVLALEFFPAVLDLTKEKRIIDPKLLLHSPRAALAQAFARLHREIGGLLSKENVYL